jgi:predicted GH43/DUF377 family glycosyl hydrolase
MKCSTNECVVFSGEQLLPPEWQPLASKGPVRTFNPGLLRTADGWIFAYRIVASDGLRRIGLCRLNHALQIVPGSQVSWSDHVRFRTGAEYPELGTRWFADPRLYRFGGRLLIYWNSGWHEPRNCQFVQELDPGTLLPVGHPRELLLRGERQKLEKNWTFFADESGGCCAVYSIQPHRVLRFSLDGSGDIEFEPLSHFEWSTPGYPENHGGLRGGAPPVLAHGQYWSFCHSVHDGANGYRYSPAVYAFSAEPPFTPTGRPTRVLELGNPFGPNRKYERLNSAVGEVIYPCGAAVDGARWLISHGINDEYSAISSLEHTEVLATLQPVAT